MTWDDFECLLCWMVSAAAFEARPEALAQEDPEFDLLLQFYTRWCLW